MKKLSSAATFCGTRPFFEKSYAETIGLEAKGPDFDTAADVVVATGVTTGVCTGVTTGVWTTVSVHFPSYRFPDVSPCGHISGEDTPPPPPPQPQPETTGADLVVTEKLTDTPPIVRVAWAAVL